MRFVRVKDRTSAILLAVVKHYVADGSLIWINQWSGYRALSNNGFLHETVNHSEQYVEPGTGCNTKGVEHFWRECKVW